MTGGGSQLGRAAVLPAGAAALSAFLIAPLSKPLDAQPVAPGVVAARAVEVPFEPSRWTVNAPRAEFVEHLGRRSLRLASGAALLRDVRFQDGTIEVDVSAPASGFAFVFFRAASAADREDVYLRMGASGGPYAVQYQPTHARAGAWQLYHGPGYTAPAVFDPKRWTRLRVEVEGRRARVFVGDSATEPALVVAALKRGVTPGAFGVVEGTAGVNAPGVYFSNFRYTVRRSAVAEPTAAELAAATPGASLGTAGPIRQWELSPAVAVDRAPLDSLPAAARGDRRGWVAADAEPNGLVNVARYRATAGPRSLVLARAVLRADRDEVRRLAFGYSDDVTVFLNGRPVFAGRNGYGTRYPSAPGLVTADDAVFLPLRRGTNELVLAVAEEFGGWGFLARLARAGAAAGAGAAVPASVNACPGPPAKGCVAAHPRATTTAPVPRRATLGAPVRGFARHPIVAEGRAHLSRKVQLPRRLASWPAGAPAPICGKSLGARGGALPSGWEQRYGGW